VGNLAGKSGSKEKGPMGGGRNLFSAREPEGRYKPNGSGIAFECAEGGGQMIARGRQALILTIFVRERCVCGS